MPGVVVTGRVFFEPRAPRKRSAPTSASAAQRPSRSPTGREVCVHAETAEAAGALSIALRDAGADAEPMVE
ncbi:MAG: hypothetical protein ACJ8GN_30140 [Longimicrobiaceae bacterium]